MSSGDFYMMGMNLGVNEVDYALLFKDVGVDVSPEDKIGTLLKEYKEAAPAAKGKIEAKLIFLLESRGLYGIDLTDPVLATLLFDKGMHVLEQRSNEKDFQSIIDNHHQRLGGFLKARIKDKYGADQMQKHYPQLCQYISLRYLDQLPPQFATTPASELGFLLMEYKDAAPAAKGKIEQRLMALLKSNTDLLEPALKVPVLAELIFDKGLHLLELHAGASEFKSLIFNHVDKLCENLTARLTDQRTMGRLQKDYPQLCGYLRANHLKKLPPCFAEKPKGMATIARSIKSLFRRKAPLQTQLQNIKDRLAVNFFNKVVSSAEKPAVITLQEVSRENSHLLDILKKAKYKILRTDPHSDTAIALDTGRFKNSKIQDLTTDPQKKAIGVHTTDKKTKEEFIFISVHIPGYELAVPDNVDGYLESLDEAFRARIGPFLKELKNSIAQMQLKYPKAKVVLQGDFNTAPEYFTAHENWTGSQNNRLKELDIFPSLVKGQNLTVDAAKLPTESNQLSEKVPYRKLDHIVYSDSLQNRVTVVEPEDQELALTQVKDGIVRFAPHLLFSDHRPVWFKVSGS